MLTPIEPQPSDVLLDGPDVLHVLGEGIGVVEAEVADAPILLSQTEVQDDGLGMPDVEVAVGLRRKPGFHPAPVGPIFLVFGDDGPDEVRAFLPASAAGVPAHGSLPYTFSERSDLPEPYPGCREQAPYKVR